MQSDKLFIILIRSNKTPAVQTLIFTLVIDGTVIEPLHVE